MNDDTSQQEINSWSFELKPEQWSHWLGRWETKQLGNIFEVVREYLSFGHWVRVERGSRLLQIIINPAFAPAHSYELFSTVYISTREKVGYRYLLLKTTWNQEADFQRWKEDKPNLLIPKFEFKWVGLDRELIDSNFGQHDIQLPSRINSLFNFMRGGLDGVFFELSFGGNHLGMRYFWWSQAPEEWRSLQDYVNTMTKIFDELLENSLSETAVSSN